MRSWVVSVAVVFVVLGGCLGGGSGPTQDPSGSPRSVPTSDTTPTRRDVEPTRCSKPCSQEDDANQSKGDTDIEWVSTYAGDASVLIVTPPDYLGTCRLGYAVGTRAGGWVEVVSRDGSYSSFGPGPGLPGAFALGMHTNSISPASASVTVDVPSRTIAGNQTFQFVALGLHPVNDPALRGLSVRLNLHCPGTTDVRVLAGKDVLIRSAQNMESGTGAYVPRFASVIQDARTSAKFEGSVVEVVAGSPAPAISGSMTVRHPQGDVPWDLARDTFHHLAGPAGEYRFEVSRVGAADVSGCVGGAACPRYDNFFFVAAGLHEVHDAGTLDKVFEVLAPVLKP